MAKLVKANEKIAKEVTEGYKKGTPYETAQASEDKIDWDYMDSYMKNLTQETENALNALQRII